MTVPDLTAAATLMVENYISKKLTAVEDIVELHNGGTTSLWLRWGPVTAISEVKDLFTDTVLSAVDEDYLVDGDRLYILNGAWDCGTDRFQITYDAGYTTIPADIAAAIAQITTALGGGESAAVYASESLSASGYSYTIASGNAGVRFMQRWSHLLDSYRNITV